MEAPPRHLGFANLIDMDFSFCGSTQDSDRRKGTSLEHLELRRAIPLPLLLYTELRWRSMSNTG